MTITTGQLILLIIGTGLIGLGLFILGWNLAVGRHRAGRRLLERDVSDLEAQVEVFQNERATDPERGWTNTGARYALNQIEQTCRRIRDDLERRTKTR